MFPSDDEIARYRTSARYHWGFCDSKLESAATVKADNRELLRALALSYSE